MGRGVIPGRGSDRGEAIDVRPTVTPESRYLDVPGCAAYLSRTEKAIYRMVERRQVPGIRVDPRIQLTARLWIAGCFERSVDRAQSINQSLRHPTVTQDRNTAHERRCFDGVGPNRSWRRYLGTSGIQLRHFSGRRDGIDER